MNFVKTRLHPGQELSLEDYRLAEEPYYRPIRDEVELFERGARTQAAGDAQRANR